MQKQDISTQNCGRLTVYIQGNIHHAIGRPAFLTVHDIGCNYLSFYKFVEHPCMEEVKKKALFLHVGIPGQEDNAADLPDNYKFPSLQEISADLVTVLNTFEVNCVVAIGEGAGANILLRFALAHQDRVIGLLLLNCTCFVAGWIETFKDKYMNWKLSSVGMNPTAESYLMSHRFGYFDHHENLEKEKIVRDFLNNLEKSMNPRNLRKYVEAFMNRTDLTAQLQRDLEANSLLVVGSNSSSLHDVLAMFQLMNKQKTEILQLEGIGDVLEEAPEKLAQSLILFSQAQGMLTTATPNLLERQRTQSGNPIEIRETKKNKPIRMMSMEDYDRPNMMKFCSMQRSSSHELIEEEA